MVLTDSSLSAPLTASTPTISSSSTSSYVQLPDPVQTSETGFLISPSRSSLLDKLCPYRRWIIGGSVVLILLLAAAVVTLSTSEGRGGKGRGSGPVPNDNGGSGGGSAAANGSCAQTKIETEGPYWVDEKLNRSDLASTATGLNLALELLVYNSTVVDKCIPIPQAQIDIWHADALGLYSDEQILGTKGRTFLRGFQLTNANGVVNFLSIWPGWYSGRTVHVHVRVRVYDSSGKIIHNQTTQLFFDDTTNDLVMANATPYNTRTAKRDTRNSNDNLFHAELLMNVTGSTKTGYSGSFAFGVPFVR